MKNLSPIDWIAVILVIVGAINWGLVGAFDYNLVTALAGVGTTIAKAVFTVVGVAGLWMIYMVFRGK